MSTSRLLSTDTVRAVILPAEGGVLTELFVDGHSVLARTPWSSEVIPSAQPALTEDEWVRRWHGGWQLNFPTTGTRDPSAHPLQGFHGAASQAPWNERELREDRILLEWEDAEGLRAERLWRVHADGIEVTTTIHNTGADRLVSLSEHLVLGEEITAPIVEGGQSLRIDADAASKVYPLDYAAGPAGAPVPWPGDDWHVLSSTTPGRVAAVMPPAPRRIAVVGPSVTAIVTWEGLDHALIWEEMRATLIEPWGGNVVALGVEPTSTPHGAGTAVPEGAISLPHDGTHSWSTRLQITPTIESENTP